VALLNDLRLNAGKPPLGFLNPWIYQTAASNPVPLSSIYSRSNTT
jgi:tripeptidyl-peptidase-1